MLISLALLFSTNPLPAQSKPSEYSVKAAYLLNFGKFMRVSPGAVPNPNSFNICIVGDDPFGSSLDSITAGEQIDGRPVRVVRLNKPDLEKPDIAKPDSRQCAIAYLSTSEEKQMGQDLAAFKDSDTLTVSDAPDFLKRGGMIQLLLVSNHIRFSVNLDPVRRTHLNLSSELLRVAASVSGNRPGEVQP
jgi:YfiR/HmsC-like